MVICSTLSELWEIVFAKQTFRFGKTRSVKYVVHILHNYFLWNSKAHHKEKLIKSDKKIICPLYENIHANDYSAAE